jgi:hypothetical protein
LLRQVLDLAQDGWPQLAYHAKDIRLMVLAKCRHAFSSCTFEPYSLVYLFDSNKRLPRLGFRPIEQGRAAQRGVPRPNHLHLAVQTCL